MLKRSLELNPPAYLNRSRPIVSKKYREGEYTRVNLRRDHPEIRPVLEICVSVKYVRVVEVRVVENVEEIER